VIRVTFFRRIGSCTCWALQRVLDCTAASSSFFALDLSRNLNLQRFSVDIKDEMNALDSPSRTHDQWIALRCQSGEESAFADLIAWMEKPLLYYATKLTDNPETALDLLQDMDKSISGNSDSQGPLFFAPVALSHHAWNGSRRYQETHLQGES
jgi:hypothetical protein